MHLQPSSKFRFWGALLALTLILSYAVTYAQVDDVTLHFLKVQQEKVHLQMMQGVAGDPWQYRILADWMINGISMSLHGLGFSLPEVPIFIAFRFFQCILIFLTAGVYYKKLGLPITANFLGLSILAWGMSTSLYDSDLSFNVFFDISFYLIAALLIMERKYVWILPLMILAAFNRETSLLIPFMLLGSAYFNGEREKYLKPAAFYTAASLAIYAAIFLGLRSYYPNQPFLTANGYYPGVGLLININLLRDVTWGQLLLTLGIIPLLGLFAYRSWPRSLTIFFWVVGPAWYIVHFFAAIVAENRLFLVPQALIFIPAALFGIPFKTAAESPVPEPATPAP